MKTILFILAGAMFLPAQNDTTRSLESEILATEETETELLAKSRRSLLNALRKNDTEKAKEIYRFIIDRFDRMRVVPLWQGELFLVNYWIAGYDTILFSLRTEDDQQDSRRRIQPPDDLFFDDMKQISQAETAALKSRIRASGKKEDEQEVLLLLLDFMLVPRTNDDAEKAKYREEINRKADEFLRFYSRSEFVPFVRQHIRYVIVPSDYGFGYSFGLGQSIPTGNYASLFSEAFAIAMEFDVTYKYFTSFMHISIGVESSARQKIVNGDEIWSKGLAVNITTANLTAGYILYRHEGLRIIPNAGIGMIEFAPPELERNKPGNDVSLYAGAFVAGLHVDIPISATDYFYLGVDQHSFFAARVSFSHSFSWEKDMLKKGGLSLLTISFGAFGHPMERDL